MGKLFTSLSDWDGQLPPQIAVNEQIWWETFPRIKLTLAPKVFGIFGGAKEYPSIETIGRVMLVAATRANLRWKFGATGGSLMNHWNCYCNKMMDEQNIVYMAGTETIPFLNFTVSGVQSNSILTKFYGRIENAPELEDAFRKFLGVQVESNEPQFSISSFKHGSWENGLDTAFKAAIWVCSNQEEALANIWKGII
jgi:hypothetical protein